MNMHVKVPLASYSIQVAANGRMNLPSGLRRKLGLTGSGKIILEESDKGIFITTVDREIDRIQRRLEGRVPSSVRVSDELLKERRAEVANNRRRDRAAA